MNSRRQKNYNTGGCEMNSRFFLCYLIVIGAFALTGTGSVQAQWPQLAKLAADDGGSDARFGCSVSLSGDYALIGAMGDDDVQGAAYIFKRDGMTWTQQVKLTDIKGVSNDQFGYSVSLYGDVALIGAPGVAEGRGAVYIFKRNGTTWTQQAILTADDGAAGDFFGCSVSLYGDYALVGAIRSSTGDYYFGAAYLFKAGWLTWTQQAKLTANSGDYVSFGISVSLYGDYALVGDGSEAAYLFKRDGTSWVPQRLLRVPDEIGFACSVSLYDNTALIGEDISASRRGAAYVFQQNESTWTFQAMLTAIDGRYLGYFGQSVSLYDDFALVGAPQPSSDSWQGHSFVFKRQGSLWILQAELTGDGGDTDMFGIAVSLSADYALVGAEWDNGNGPNSGSAYIFGKCPTMDANGDCFVDLQDLAVLASQWLTGYR